MFQTFLVGVLSLEPGFLALVLVTFSLIMTWFKRRSFAKFEPTISGDFLTRHINPEAKRYSYKG